MSKEESVPPTKIGISDVLYSAQPKNRPVEGICDQFLSMVTKNTAVSRETLMRPVGGPTNIQSVVAGVKQKMNRGRAIRFGVVHTVIHSDIHRPMHRLPSFPPRRQRSSWDVPRDFRSPPGAETLCTDRHDLWKAADRLARECLRAAPPRTEWINRIGPVGPGGTACLGNPDGMKVLNESCPLGRPSAQRDQRANHSFDREASGHRLLVS